MKPQNLKPNDICH